MKNTRNTRRRSLSEDLAKVFLISEVPKLAKLLVDAVPDLTYERYIKDYKKIWNIALPAASLVILRKYTGSELEKTFTVQMSAGISRAINERAKKIKNTENLQIAESNDSTENNGLNDRELKPFLKIKDCISFLDQAEFKSFMTRLSSLPPKQRSDLLDSIMPPDRMIKDMISVLQKNGKFSLLEEKRFIKLCSCDPERVMKIYYLESILNFSDEQFRNWASLCSL